ncbi:hypothetical protein roselon_03644 [Roseibacterium elongatum DSM 19469]|uniref:Uncharacterized protein n=1 Tax=Roseicyclus elongatus DSM 19469 TaxID=1294273 RepID=W8SA44_9RHOB|nr:hypothetical protein roselon_03644 [Roseibacterium elongatum DSM 19469]
MRGVHWRPPFEGWQRSHAGGHDRLPVGLGHGTGTGKGGKRR